VVAEVSTTLSEMVREQVLTEGPKLEDRTEIIWYTDHAINGMSNVELLERISDALQKACTGMAVRPWV